MQNETRNCQNCKQNFTIEPEDFSFYEKIKVPPPTWCPECRQQRRYAWRNERTLYRRNCELCKKSMVTIYHPDSDFKVYCSTCWWGDAWSAQDFGLDVDFTKPFFEQFKDLQKNVPRIGLLAKNSVNSEYTNHSADNKNCYLCFDVFGAENSLYSSNCWDGMKDSCDCNMITDKGQFLYECVACDRSYNCQFCLLTHDTMDSMYCFDCRNCSDCFMCFNLRNKKYCIFNKQYTKEEYQQEIAKLDLSSYTTRTELYEKWLTLLKGEAVHRFAQIEKSINVSGDVIVNSKNCKNVFDTFESENIKYSTIVLANDGMDLYSVGLDGCELVYESHALVGASNVKFTNLSYSNSFVEYCDLVYNSSNLFGCIGLKKSNYCILNKQYTKEEYEIQKDKLIKHMQETGEYGEFFPANLSPFGYNETHGQIFMPVTKAEALGHGYNWQDDIQMTKGKETILPKDLPERVQDTGDSITREVLACIICARNYNIVPNELAFYKTHNLPLPSQCPGCRYERRIKLCPMRKLWHRTCMCDKAGHNNHAGKCSVEFETSYAPDRPEKVYCERCYQNEVY